MALVRPEKELYGGYQYDNSGNVVLDESGNPVWNYGVLSTQHGQDAMKALLGSRNTGMVSWDSDTERAGLGAGGTHVVTFGDPPSTPKKKPKTPGGGGYINYGPIIQGIKASADQNIPLYFQQYNEALRDPIDINNAYHDMGDQAIAQARDLYEKQNANQRGLVDDMWYYQTQKFQNSRMQHEDAINGQYGSIWQRMNDLYNLMDDQMDQTNLNNLKQGLFQNGVEFQTAQNTTATNMAENDLQTYTQIRDILRQGGAALTDYANSFLSQLSAYGDKEYRDANGKVTPAGWAELAKFGIENDGNGGFTFNYNKFSPNADGTWGSGNMSMDEYLSGLRESRPQYWTVDYLPMIRDMQNNRTTVDYLQNQARRNRDEAAKNGKLSAVDYTDYITERYGR